MTCPARFSRNIAFVDVGQPDLDEDSPFTEYVVHGAVYYPRVPGSWDEPAEPAEIEYEGISIKGQINRVNISAETDRRVCEWLMSQAENR